jgi:hypothetical protein
MTHPRRTSTRTTLQLETLDDRIAPAHLGAAGAWHAAIAHHRAALHSHAAAAVHASTLHGHQAARTHLSASPTHALHRATHAIRPALTGGHGVLRTRHGSDASAAAAPASTPVTPLVANPPTQSPAPVAPVSPAPTPAAAATELPSSLPANAGNILNTIYQEYQQFKKDGGTGTFTSSWSPFVMIQGTSVGVDVHGNGSGNFDSLVVTLRNLGMQVTATDSVTQTVEGMLPIDALPTVALEPQTLSVSPSYLPVFA